jgi:F-type H+-transporting ATPase subunit gamma
LHRNLLADSFISDRVALCELRPVIGFLKNKYLDYGIDSGEIVYSRPVDALVHEQVSSEILPMLNFADEINALKRHMHISDENATADPRGMLFKPGVRAIVSKLSHTFLAQSMSRNVSEAKAAEHSARMFAAKNAADDASSLSKGLAKESTKAKQAKITSEIMEIATAPTG